MGILKEIIETINSILQLSQGGWTKLKDDQVSAWLLRSAKKRYRHYRNPIGRRYHFIGRKFFYRVWYRGKRDWVFYRKKK